MKNIVVLKASGDLIHKGEYAGQEWLDQNINTNAWGKPERWLPDFLGGVETRQVLIEQGYEAYDAMEYAEDGSLQPVHYPAKEDVYVTEYLHPAEYTYEIIEESLDVVKARKLAELSAISKQKNPYLDLQNLGYRMMNIQSGKYAKEGKQSKADAYLADYNAISDALANEYLRCENLVNNAATEQEVLAVTFNL